MSTISDVKWDIESAFEFPSSSSYPSSDPFIEIDGKILKVEKYCPQVSVIYISELTKAVDLKELDGTYDIVWKSREVILLEIDCVLDQISLALANREIPAIKVINRNTDSAYEYGKHAITLNIRQLKIMELRYGSDRFGIYISILKDIQEGLLSNVTSKKRDLYYKHPDLYLNQTKVDDAIENISCSFGVPRRCLNVIAGSKGLVFGKLTLCLRSRSNIDCSLASDHGTLIPDGYEIESFQTSAKCVLVIEKESTFSKLLSYRATDESFEFLDSCILITGKGYPDVATRMLVKLLCECLPIFCLIDGDPHGFSIYLNYKYGSKSMAFSSSCLTVPSIIFLGIHPSLWLSQLKIQTKDLLALRKNDVKKCISLLRNPHVYQDTQLKREISRLLFYNYKSEIQSASSEQLKIYIKSRLNQLM